MTTCSTHPKLDKWVTIKCLHANIKVSRINVYDVRKTTFVPTAQAASVYSNNVHCTASTSSLHHRSYMQSNLH